MEGYLFGGMDGNIHQLRLATLPDIDPPVFGRWSDTSESPVVSTWKSKEITGGSWHMAKQVRQVLTDAIGEEMDVQLILRKTNNTEDIIALNTTDLPAVNNEVPDIDTDSRICKAFAIRIEGQSLEIEEVTIAWRGFRMNSGQV